MAWGEKEKADEKSATSSTSKKSQKQAITIKKSDLDMMEDEIKRFTNRLTRLRSLFDGKDSLTIHNGASVISSCRRASHDVSVEMRNFRVATALTTATQPTE